MDWGPKYDSIPTSIANRQSPISFQELFGQLLAFELRLEAHDSTSIHAIALYTCTSSGRSGPRDRSKNRARG